MPEHHHHQPPSEIVKRLKRADGHLKSIIEMIETDGALPREQRRPIDEFKEITKYL